MKKSVSFICEIYSALEKYPCLRTLQHVHFVARNDAALNVDPIYCKNAF